MTTTIFLPQSRMDSRKARSLSVNGRSGGGHEQDEVRARHELARQRLVLAQDGVGAGRVHDVDVAEHLHGAR